MKIYFLFCCQNVSCPDHITGETSHQTSNSNSIQSFSSISATITDSACSNQVAGFAGSNPAIGFAGSTGPNPTTDFADSNSVASGFAGANPANGLAGASTDAVQTADSLLASVSTKLAAAGKGKATAKAQRTPSKQPLLGGKGEGCGGGRGAGGVVERERG